MKPTYYLLLASLFIFNTSLSAAEAPSPSLESQTNNVAKVEPAIMEKNDSEKSDTFSRVQRINFSFGAGLQKLNLDFGFFDQDESGFATSLKGNYGVSNHLMVGFVRNVSFFEPELSNDLYNVGITGLSATYYLQPSFPSAYGIFALGATEIDSIDDDFKKESGSGFLIGGGFQASERLQFEATHIRADIDDMDLEASTTQFTLNYVIWIDL